MWVRTTGAFVVSPVIGGLAASLVEALLSPDARPAYLLVLVSSLVIAYAVTLVIGVPWFFVWPWVPRTVWGYGLAGAIVAAIAAVLIVVIFPLHFAFLSILAGAIAGLMFGIIVLPTSNNRWRGP